MKKIALATAIALLTYSTNAQVGIGNTNPNATLDISATNTGTPANTDGILIPRVHEFPTTNPTAAQDAMMIFVTGSGTATRGFYYWNHGTTSWVVVGSGTGVQKIDDLTDGKSDSDGSDDGSSIFIGVDAGAADDSSSNANVGIGYTALEATIGGRLNTALGWGSLRANLGSSNTAVGYLSGSGITTGAGNTTLGRNSLISNTIGNYNTALGFYAGSSNTGSGNLFLGANAGFNHGSGSNIMYIDNTDADPNAALIYGEFGADNSTTGNILRTNSEFQIGNPTGTGYAFPATDGTANQILTTNGAGQLSFNTPSGDNDWYEVGTTNPANDITDNIFTQGKVGIGSNALYTLDVDYTGTDLRATTIDYTYSGTSTPASALNIITEGTGVGSSVYGGYFQVRNSSNSSNTHGLYILNSASAIGNIGLSIAAVGTGQSNTGFKSYAVNATGSNLAAEFGDSFFPGSGDVVIHDQLQINNGSFQLIDGTQNTDYILRTDALGNATWVDPSTVFNTIGWSVNGNAGTNSTTNFIGTTDNQALSIRVNNSNKLRITNKGQIEIFNTASSVYLGELAGASFLVASAFSNVGVGFRSLTTNSSGSNNTAIGAYSMEDNSTGFQNTALGTSSLTNNTTGRDNVALGHFALSSNTFGVNNVAVGPSAMSSNTGGSNNLALGRDALNDNTLGNFNIGLGSSAGHSNTSGDYNLFLGVDAGYFETGSHKLYIENTDADADNALLYGEFDNDILRTNATLQIGNPSTTGFALPSADGTSGQIMETDGSGSVSWVNPADTDDQTIDNFGLSGDTLGLSLEDDGQPAQTVDLSAVSYNVSNFALAKMTMSMLQAHPVSTWAKQNFDGTTIDIGSNFDTTNDLFDVTEAGQYRISASYRSSTAIATNSLFGISVYVNGSAVKTEITNHYASGAVVRKVDTLETLAVGDEIEIYFFANVALTVNNSTLYTTFEVERIR